MCGLHSRTKDRGLPSTLPFSRLLSDSFTLVSNIASTEAVRRGDAMGPASFVMSRLASAGPRTLVVDWSNKSQRQNKHIKQMASITSEVRLFCFPESYWLYSILALISRPSNYIFFLSPPLSIYPCIHLSIYPSSDHMYGKSQETHPKTARTKQNRSKPKKP